MTHAAALVAQYGFVLVALIICAGELGLPIFIPGEIALLLVGSKLISSTGALLVAVGAFGLLDFLATFTLHLMARTGGNALLRSLIRRFNKEHQRPEDLLQRWRDRLGGYDSLVIFVTRLIPVVRMWASLTSGLIQMRIRSFVLGAAPSAFLWAATPLVLGYVLRTRVSGVAQQYNQALPYVLGLLAAVILVGGAGWYVRSRRREGVGDA